MSENTVIVIGAGGHTRSLINVLELNKLRIFGLYDEAYNPAKKEKINGYELLGKIEDVPDNIEIVISIGDNIKRSFLFERFRTHIYGNNIIHPRAMIEKNVNIKASNQIFADVYINSNVIIGKDNILNTRCTIEHEVEIGNHNHIAVGSILCGRVKIGNLCFIGAGAIVIDKVSICDNVTIGANAVVINDIVESGTYVGIPARRIK